MRPRSHRDCVVVMENCRIKFHFRFLSIVFVSLFICHCIVALFSILHAINVMHQKPGFTIGIHRKLRPSVKHLRNIQFSSRLMYCCAYSALVLLSIMLLVLLLSGDVHKNPGPLSSSSHSSICSASDLSISSNVSSIDLSNHISFVHYNVQSVFSKLDILYTELRDFDIIAFSETWLNSSTSNNDLLFNSFHPPERKDRTSNSYGGLLLYIRDALYYRRRKDLEIADVECIWIELNLYTKTVLFGLFYRPPNTNVLDHSNLVDSIHLAVDTGIDNIIITGDFNLNINSQTTFNKVSSICREFSLTQTISEPTHFTESSQSIIDLIFTSKTDLIHNSGVGDPFLQQELRYHCPVFGILNLKSKSKTVITRHIWLFDKGDYNLLRSKASQFDWNSAKDQNIDKYANNINQSIISIASHCIPNRNVTIRSQEPLWITSEIKRLIRKRKRAYRKVKRTNKDSDWLKFRTLRNMVTKLIKESKLAHQNRQVENLKNNSKHPKQWWSCLKSFIKPNSSSGIPPLSADGEIITDDFQKANCLNNYFASQSCLTEPTNHSFPNISPSSHPPLQRIKITPTDVHDALKCLKTGKASGPSGINNRILRELSVELSLPLSELFNVSLSTGQFPEPWKQANVSPLFKSGDPSLAKNYRPISLLDTIGKVFEKILFKYIFNYIREHNLLTPFQSGFIPGDTTVNQLVYLVNMFSQAVDSGKEVRVVFCDISKAFDRVWHKGLLFKLRSFGISGPLLSWFSSYLSNRKQSVLLPGVQSEWKSVSAGVPQGSILGPLLFLIYINDIVEGINANIRLFADDTGLSIIVDCPVNAANILNTDLNTISSWARQWLVAYNPSKTKSLIISRKTRRQIHPPLYLFDEEISEVEHHKHLGVLLSHDLRWSDHIDYTLSKAYNRINILRKLKYTLDRRSLETIYISFIRPILEYSDVLFDNCTIHEQNELEKVQYEAARIVTGTNKLISIEKLLSEVKWETLKNRRKKHKLILFYKMKNNLTPQYLSSLVPESIDTSSAYSLRNSDDIQVPYSRTNLYHNSFLPSVIRDYNNLSPEIKHAPSLSSFKRLLFKNVSPAPKYFYFGNRKTQILHTKLRTNCSSLAHDLYNKNITDSPNCQCGEPETTLHFFLKCPRYTIQRTLMVNTVSNYRQISIKTLLFGDTSLTNDTNTAIFASVHAYILATKRFSDSV